MRDLCSITVHELAMILAVSDSDLFRLLEEVPNSYSCFNLKKKSGSRRRIEAPNDVLKAVQNKLRNNILDNIAIHSSVYGKPGTSIVDALKYHVRQNVVITIDIENFFSSIKSKMILACLCSIGFSISTARVITRLTTFKGHLPQGAPTSPTLARIYISPAAERISLFVKSLHSSNRCSFYVDDITISGNAGIARAKGTIAKIIRAYGLRVNTAKTKVMSSRQDQISLNVKLNHRLEATNAYLEEVNELIHSLGKSDPRVIGKLAFVKHLRSSNY